MVDVRLTLDPHEQEMLAWLADQAGLTVKQLLGGLVGDLTGSHATGGSDERQFAFAWYKRRFATDYIDAATALAWRASLAELGDGEDVDEVDPLDDDEVAAILDDLIDQEEQRQQE